jgi:hypothetical protein
MTRQNGPKRGKKFCLIILPRLCSELSLLMADLKHSSPDKGKKRPRHVEVLDDEEEVDAVVAPVPATVGVPASPVPAVPASAKADNPPPKKLKFGLIKDTVIPAEMKLLSEGLRAPVQSDLTTKRTVPEKKPGSVKVKAPKVKKSTHKLAHSTERRVADINKEMKWEKWLKVVLGQPKCVVSAADFLSLPHR